MGAPGSKKRKGNDGNPIPSSQIAGSQISSYAPGGWRANIESRLPEIRMSFDQVVDTVKARVPNVADPV